ncbi:MAG: DNA topoisomerase 4 subunit A [Lachnospiraceae bacterium]|nr:DNA topoisomerase 4 subunit A [Lachnospiraceae bacterium]
MSTKQEQLVQLDFAEEMRTSFRDYALSVIISRAIPDVRDGLKPVQRRILYAMNELGLSPDKPHRKSARIVGDTMGKYHPHGDSSIYEALVHMSQDYSLNVPLVDGHGNFGSIDGDGAAAMRYTEARLSQGAMRMLESLERGIVPFMPNFDENEKEPTVLPAQIPNLLINGTTGIAVGMATNIPPHNPGEVIDACIALLDKPEITNRELLKHVKGPDFPTGGIIVNAGDIPTMYETGEGKLRIRALTHMERGEYGRTNIVVTQIPYTVSGNKVKLVEALSALMRDKVFDEIYDVRDESSKEGIRVVIEVKKDRDAENLLNGLFKKTPLEDTYSVNLLAVKEKQPIVFDLKGMISEFISFRKELTILEHKDLLEKARDREEIVSGLLRATDIIDLIIEILRGSKSVKQAKDCLVHGDVTDIAFKSEKSRMMAFKLDFTMKQANAILAMPLSRLIGLEMQKLVDEHEELLGKIASYEEILGSESALRSVIRERLKTIKKEISYPRRTRIDEITLGDYVEEVKIEELAVLIDRFGYTKCVDEQTFQKATPEQVAEFTHVVHMKSDGVLCIFTDGGNLNRVKAEKIPRTKLKEKGTLIHNLCRIDEEEAVLYCSFEELFDSLLLFTTASGAIKLTSGVEFETARLQMASTKLADKDKVVSINVISATEALDSSARVLVATKKGMGSLFPFSEVPELKKTGRGVRSITLGSGDTVEGAAVIRHGTDCVKIAGKTIDCTKLRCRARGGKGTKVTYIKEKE